jgi:glycosyltransferase involved in cell wall biosynthesis
LLVLLRLLRPDYIFSQSSRWHALFSKTVACTRLLPNGVDTRKFSPPADPDKRIETRARYGFSADDRLVVHAGPVNLNRNLELLLQLHRQGGWKVLIIGSTTAPYVPELAEKLQAGGVTVINEYVPDINMIYAMADVYVFPVMDPGGSIEIPLTVLEAMSCDTPVVTTRFRGLPEILPASPALRFFSSGEQLAGSLEEVIGVKGNREAIRHLDWHNIAAMIIEYTQQCGIAKP